MYIDDGYSIQESGLEITFPKFPIMMIGSHDLFGLSLLSVRRSHKQFLADL
jgi:hypothetical protein